MIRPRQGRTAIAVLSVAAFAAVVTWFGVLKEPRPSAPNAPAASAPPGTVAPPAPGPTDSRAPSQPAAPADAPRAGSAAVSPPEPPPAPAPPPAEPPRDAAAAAPPAEPPRDAAAAAPPAAPPRQAAAVPPEPPRETVAAPAAPLAPSFDVVRVEPSGDAVIAGRAVPGATIDLLRNGTSHARAAADQSGLFAFVPPPLPPGSHEIVLQSIAPDGTRARSRDSITIVIADDKATKPLVALASPDRPTVLLSTPDRPAPPPAKPALPAAPRGPDVAAAPPPGTPAEPAARRPESAPAAPAPRPQVRIAAIDAEDGGRLFVSGQAAPGATVRLYLNDTLIAPGGAGADGKVAFAISRGVRPGGYRIRLDDVDPVSGEVRSRAEVQFAMPVEVAVPLPPQVPPMVTGPQDVAALALPSAPPAAPPPAAAPAGPDPIRAPGQGAAPAGPGPAAVPAAPGALSTAPAGPGPAAVPAPAPGALSPAVPAAPRTAAAPGAAERQVAERAIAAGTVLIPEINTAIVARGDNLWNISRRIYGQGVRYTVIYGANQPQIRNPDLIYPGQVFVLPPEQAPAPRL